MTIIEVLANENLRISCGSRWLVLTKLDGRGGYGYTVYERRRNARNTTTVIETENEEVAVRYLLGGVCEGC